MVAISKTGARTEEFFVSLLSRLFEYIFAKLMKKSPKIVSILTRWEESSRVWNQSQKNIVPSVLSLQLELDSPQLRVSSLYLVLVFLG